MKDRLTYSNVVATLALFLALGGGIAWALEKNSVKSRHIKNGQVKTGDLKSNAVKSPKVATDSLTGADIDEETLALDDVVSRSATSTSAGSPIITADCNPGERVVGGGASLSTAGAILRINRPEPSANGSTPTGWTAASSHPSDTSHQVAAIALCASP